MLATSAELLTMDFIFLSKYFWRPTLNKIKENIAIKIDGNNVVAENKTKYLNAVNKRKNKPKVYHHPCAQTEGATQKPINEGILMRYYKERIR